MLRETPRIYGYAGQTGLGSLMAHCGRMRGSSKVVPDTSGRSVLPDAVAVTNPCRLRIRSPDRCVMAKRRPARGAHENLRLVCGLFILATGQPDWAHSLTIDQ
jgi:hypothetical protein